MHAYADWLTSEGAARLVLSIHLIAPPVYREIASGRLDVLELLSCHDTRFWAQVHEGDELLERRLFQLDPNTPLQRVVEDLDLPLTGWDVEVQPAPDLLGQDESQRALEERLAEPIYQVGVVPGSTLHFRRKKQDASK